MYYSFAWGVFYPTLSLYYVFYYNWVTLSLKSRGTDETFPIQNDSQEFHTQNMPKPSPPLTAFEVDDGNLWVMMEGGHTGGLQPPQKTKDSNVVCEHFVLQCMCGSWKDGCVIFWSWMRSHSGPKGKEGLCCEVSRPVDISELLMSTAT